MSDWRWFWVSPRLFLIRSFRRYQAHQDKHQTFFAIVRVISITSVSWMFCTSIIWPVYDSVVNAFSSAVRGTKANDNSATSNNSKSTGNDDSAGKDGASSRRGDGGLSSTAAKKFAATQAAKIARGPKSGKALTAAEIAARAEKAAKRRKGN
jgi:hypothetical protein